jgi:hypothetical protein
MKKSLVLMAVITVAALCPGPSRAATSGSSRDQHQGDEAKVKHAEQTPARWMATATTSNSPTRTLAQSRATGRAQVVRPAANVAQRVSSLSSVCHLGLNPPVLGGPVNSSNGRSGAISGTTVRRRP